MNSQRSSMLRHVQVLAEEIGQRGTGTPGEAAAADYVANQLETLGLTVEHQTFMAVASQNSFPLAIDLLVLLSIMIYPLGESITRWLAAFLSLAAPLLLWQIIRTSNSPLRFLLHQVQSRNVITRILPQKDTISTARKHVVILAHLDTNRCRLAWQSSTVNALEPLTYLNFVMLGLPGIFFIAGEFFKAPSWIWWLSLVSGAYVVGTVITLWKDDRTPFSYGANDNAASVAVALETASQLANKPLKETEVWLAFTGAEETDHQGLYTLLKMHDKIMRNASFIGLEGVGGGELVYLTRQGLCDHYQPDPKLLALAQNIALLHPELGVQGAQMTMEDETGTLRRKGYQAMCIAGRDPDTGTLPHWHRKTDTVDTISSEVMERACRFVLKLLEKIEQA